MSAPRPSPGGAFLRGLGLGVLAVSQPLYSLIAAQPEFFAARGADAADILSVAALALLPALAWGLAAAAAVALGGGEAASAALAAALLAAQASAKLSAPAWTAVCAAAALAASWSIRGAHGPRAREFLTWAALPAVLLPALFLARAPWPEPAAPQPPAPAGAKPAPVVFVVFDEFPLATLLGADGAVDPLWFPSFARLSREAVWYREARSVSEDTFKAVPALLTGAYPRPPKAPWYRDYPDNLFTALASTHRLSVDESHTALCPPALCRPVRPPFSARLAGLGGDLAVLYGHRSLPRFWAARLPSVSHSWKGFAQGGAEFSWDAHNAAAGESYVDRAGAFRRFSARAAAPPGAPALHFLHTMLPHPPWVYLPSGAVAFTPNEPIVIGDKGREDRWEADPALAAAAWQRHILQARFADRLLGELTDALKASGTWDGTLLVVAADHGAAFRPGARRRAWSPLTAADIVPVPLFVKYPGDGPRGTDERPASLVDVLPTVLAVQNLPLPAGLDGSDLRLPGHAPEFLEKDGSRRRADVGWNAARKESARRRALLGDGADPSALYRIGPAGRTVGRQAAALRRSKRPPCRVRLRQALSVPTPYSKAYLSGDASCPDGPAGPRPVVAAVDGTVVAAGVIGAQAGLSAPLNLMLPEESLADGATPELFVGSGEGTDLEFSPLAVDSEAWRLQGGALFAADGLPRTLGVPAAGARGAIRTLKDVLELKGEARSGDGKPGEAVVVFSGSAFVFSGAPDPESGRFDFALPRDLAGDPARLGVYGVRGTEAWAILE